MTRPKKKIYRIIRRSCLTGKAVWLSPERSYKVEWQAYKNACEREIRYVRQWKQTMAIRRQNILQMLDELMARMPILGELTPEQKAAIKQIRDIADNPPELYRDFYDHILAERRMKKKAKLEREKYRAQKMA